MKNRKPKTIVKDMDKLTQKFGCERFYEVRVKLGNGELTQKQKYQWTTLENELSDSNSLERYRKSIKKGHEWKETDSWISGCQNSYDFDFRGMIDCEQGDEGVKHEDIDEWRVELLKKFDHYMECLNLDEEWSFDPQRVWKFIIQKDMKDEKPELLLNNNEEFIENIEDCKYSFYYFQNNPITDEDKE